MVLMLFYPSIAKAMATLRLEDRAGQVGQKERERVDWQSAKRFRTEPGALMPPAVPD
jgi:hypothetical protein